MKSLWLAGALCVVTTASFADGQYWVVGNTERNKCEIVTTNPVIGGNIWFGTGPYRSMSDAKLARSTISQCPKPAEDAKEDD